MSFSSTSQCSVLDIILFKVSREHIIFEITFLFAGIPGKLFINLVAIVSACAFASSNEQSANC